MSEKANKKNPSIIAGYTAIGISVTLIIIKAFAYYVTGSLGILSSLADSTMDSMVSIVALTSVYYASRPADADHRWGHGKMEAVSALFQASIIAGGGAFLIFEAVGRLAQPVEISNYKSGIVVLLISIALSVVLVWVQKKSLKEAESLAIEADSFHYSSDIIINIGAVIVLFAAMLGLPTWIDTLFAVGVGGFMGILAKDIAGKSLDMLLDRELPDEERKVIISIMESHEKVLGWHDLRMNKNGARAVIIVDIEVNPDLSLLEAHSITRDLEEQFLKIYEGADILIHVDPEGDKTDARHRVQGVHI